MRRTCRWMGWLVVAGALAAIGVALSAGLLGIDGDRKWGPFRTSLLAAGVGVIALVACMRLADSLDRRLVGRRRVLPSPKAEVSTTRIGHRPRLGAATKWLGLVGLLVGIELLYVWLVSAGHWTAWPQRTEYYSMLADAFLHGQTALLTKPPPELAALPYPWPKEMWRGIPVIGDLSYFGRNYYMYFGPAPGAVAAMWKVATGQPMRDDLIVFLASSLIFVFSALILLDLKQRHSPDLPAWLFGCGLIAVATVHPLMWNLNRAAIHEAAIACGQAFLLAGLWFALPTIEARKTRVGRLALAGTMWALALASRLVLVGAVGLLAIATLWGWFHAASSDGRRGWAARGLAALGVPIISSLALLGLYDYLRFGSPFETGLRYQLSIIDLNHLVETGLLFNSAYLPSNVLYYLLAPLHAQAVFPLVRRVFGEFSSISAFLARFAPPATQHVEDATGVLPVIPFVIASIISVGSYLCLSLPQGLSEGDQAPNPPNTRRSDGLLRMAGLFLAASLLAFAPTAVYFWVTTRFMLDFDPLLMLAAVIGTWVGIRSGDSHPIRTGLLSILIVATLLFTVCVGLLLAVARPGTRFEHLNLGAWSRLLQLYSP